jgi:GTPase SAR1 family protein
MIGDQAVGKTALLMRYADDVFHENVLPTIGIDFKIKVRRAQRAQSRAAHTCCPHAHRRARRGQVQH